MSFQNQRTATHQIPQQSPHMFLNPNENGSGLPDNMVQPEKFIDNLLPNNVKSFGNKQKYFPLRNHRIVNKYDTFMPRNYNLGQNVYEYDFVKPIFRVPINQGAKFI